MPTTLHCPHCHRTLTCADEAVGGVVRCGHCSRRFQAAGGVVVLAPPAEALAEDLISPVSDSVAGIRQLRQAQAEGLGLVSLGLGTASLLSALALLALMTFTVWHGEKSDGSRLDVWLWLSAAAFCLSGVTIVISMRTAFVARSWLGGLGVVGGCFGFLVSTVLVGVLWNLVETRGALKKAEDRDRGGFQFISTKVSST